MIVELECLNETEYHSPHRRTQTWDLPSGSKLIARVATAEANTFYLDVPADAQLVLHTVGPDIDGCLTHTQETYTAAELAVDPHAIETLPPAHAVALEADQ